MDSSGWIEFFTGGPLAERYAAYFSPRNDLITPTIVLYEVYKKNKREKAEETALMFSGQLSANPVVQLTESIAYLAADLSLRHGLDMAVLFGFLRSRSGERMKMDARDLPAGLHKEGKMDSRLP
jgi:toxin FitB